MNRYIIELDINLKITYTNKKFRQLIGYIKEDLYTIKFTDLFDEKIPNRLIEKAISVANEGGAFASFIKLIDFSNNSFWIEVVFIRKENGYMVKAELPSEMKAETVELAFQDMLKNVNENFECEYCGRIYV